MFRFVVFTFILFLFIFPIPVRAQTPTVPLVNPTITSGAQNLLNSQIDQYRQSNMPSSSIGCVDTFLGLNCLLDALKMKLVGNYTFSAATQVPPEAIGSQNKASTSNWFENIPIVSFLIFGDKNAQNLANRWLPSGGNGLTMATGFDAARCAVLPGGCSQVSGTPGVPTPTITPGGPTVTPVPTGSLASLVYYSQCDPVWRNHGMTPPYVCPSNLEPPVYMTIGTAGCGPTSTAMILATILHDSTSYTPDKIWDEFTNNGYMQCTTNAGNLIGSHGGSSLTSIMSILQNHGISSGIRAFPGNQDLARADMMGYLSSGYHIIAVTSQYGGHILVVDSITKSITGSYTVWVNDPNAGCSSNSGPSVLPSDVNFILGYLKI